MNTPRETSRDEDAEGATARCIAACNECNRVCLSHIDHCLTLGGAHAEPAHITMLLTCASVCRSAVELMSLDSAWHATMCDLCAQVCEECGDACEDLGDMDDCVAACQDCSDACREMAGEQFDEDDDAEDDEEDEDELAADERMN